MKKLFAFLTVIAFCPGLHAQDSAAFKMDRLIIAYANIGRFNGTVFIAKQDTILLQKGYGIKKAA